MNFAAGVCASVAASHTPLRTFAPSKSSTPSSAIVTWKSPGTTSSPSGTPGGPAPPARPPPRPVRRQLTDHCLEANAVFPDADIVTIAHTPARYLNFSINCFCYPHPLMYIRGGDYLNFAMFLDVWNLGLFPNYLLPLLIPFVSSLLRLPPPIAILLDCNTFGGPSLWMLGESLPFDCVLDEVYLGFERWLPLAPKVKKPRSIYNAASLAYIEEEASVGTKEQHDSNGGEARLAEQPEKKQQAGEDEQQSDDSRPEKMKTCQRRRRRVAVVDVAGSKGGAVEAVGIVVEEQRTSSARQRRKQTTSTSQKTGEAAVEPTSQKTGEAAVAEDGRSGRRDRR
ncbi:hypothetical protein KSP39_PZI013706 [Platanthera zijinensis]|uniref:Uncharacterized protein n=1 Tax=Platanthera zijinensis TaxID=2320716 RepID=A0AAP0G3N8_9ASPA